MWNALNGAIQDYIGILVFPQGYKSVGKKSCELLCARLHLLPDLFLYVRIDTAAMMTYTLVGIGRDRAHQQK